MATNEEKIYSFSVGLIIHKLMAQDRWMQFEVRSFVCDQAVQIVLRGKKQDEQRRNAPYERVRSLQTLCRLRDTPPYQSTETLLSCH